LIKYLIIKSISSKPFMSVFTIKRNLLLIIIFFTKAMLFSQTCDCKTNYEWIKKTFEENDAGFEYAIETKGKQVYLDHNKRIFNKVIKAKTLTECTSVLNEWLQIFRSGHLGIQFKEQIKETNTVESKVKFPDWETYSIKTENFKKYLDKKKNIGYEGIWEMKPYIIGIKKEGEKYVGFIIESDVNTWSKGQVKLKFNISKDKKESIFFMRDHTAVEFDHLQMKEKNHLQINDFNLFRLYPKMEVEPEYVHYLKFLKEEQPYLEKLNETTLYMRIPSFKNRYKKLIDSVLNVNKKQLLKTENLIIDIRNNGGGSDSSYEEITPYLYTNPIRMIDVEFLSTKLNNQRMLDFINEPKYGFDDEGKKWAKEAYDKLELELGKFVNLSEEVVSIKKRDTIYPFPKNIGVVINKGNASTAEEFLLEAKQSKKVKLFGVTTFGMLDISNMYFVESPCNEFKLGYSLSRSMRIPNHTIDDKGIQPDYYIDGSIPKHKWIEFVNERMGN